MKRRELVISGVALAASRGFAKAQQTSASAASSSGLSHKVLAHYTRLKSFSAIPKSAGKQAKYISFLTTLLSLTPSQQTQLASIFSAASASLAALKGNMKAARVDLGKFVTSNDASGMSRTSNLIGKFAAERHTIGAGANAAFFQILTAEQQATLNQYRS
jgi:Spy/CpxP family protein refolding chaperone